MTAMWILVARVVVAATYLTVAVVDLALARDLAFWYALLAALVAVTDLVRWRHRD